ncbi:MAG TPA: CPBP family intramembrane glutamic endopeptidase [Candidatus Dormibacteraeota bacterium]|nr:CPBP family intramembrane glutamic endopeptidase [Candidatus Dormibacteraeota bacterium]
MVANVAVGKSWANVATWLVGGLASWGLAASSAINLAAALLTTKIDQTTFVFYASTIVGGVAAGGFLIRPIRRDVAALLPIDIDNPVHTVALVLAVLLFATQTASLAFTDVLGYLASQPPETIVDVFLDEVPSLVIAVAGVGLFVRRGATASVERLAFVRPAWWHVVLALAAAGAFLAIITGFDSIHHLMFPQLAKRVDAVDAHIFSQLVNTSWVGIVAIAVVPGICEDALFRGALQPRLGLVPTALLFTSTHPQYGFSLVLAGVFVLALGLGLIRKYTNTTTSMTAHVAYNLLASISLAGTLLYVAVALEVILVVVTAYAVLAGRVARRPAQG